MRSKRCLPAVLFSVLACAQPPRNDLIREGAQLDLDGKTAEAKSMFQKAIDTAAGPAARAGAQRAMAMSWAFEGNCAKTTEYENQVIDYWKTQEAASPGNAFYQEGEMADEAARVCIDYGNLDAAYDLYKRGHDAGMKEPGIPPGRKAVWDFRWEHAQARIAARRGNKAEAARHVARAVAILDDLKQKDAALYQQQSAFVPYLTGYVALYTGDYKTAVQDLDKASQNDAFVQCLLGMAYEKLGDEANATAAYRKAFDAARGHNPPAAFARPFARKKLS